MDADGHPSAIPHHVIDRASEKEDFILLLTRSSPQVEIVIFTADRNHSTTPHHHWLGFILLSTI